LVLVGLFYFGNALEGSCLIYANKTDNCQIHCGSCFNPGARQGIICIAPSTGYYCPADDPPPGGDMAFACMDWTFGSTAMKKAEEAFNTRTNDNVYFGVGSYGTSSDPQRGLGACYRLTVDTLDRHLLVQSINTGSDVAGNQFDLQIGDGGAGAYNTCAGKASSMYPGPVSVWGKIYGGADFRTQCAGLPPYPRKAGPMKAAGDSLITLCQYSFDKKVRGEGGSNPTLLNVTRVRCPPELYGFTQMQRSDDPPSYHGEESVENFPNVDKKCQADIPGGGTAYCLTRMMDCRKPSGGFKDNVQAKLMVDRMRVLQPCMSDGYTRIDVQCGCLDCYC